MARKEITTKDLVVHDPETGKEIAFTQEQRMLLESTKMQIKSGLLQVALGLRTIRDNRLYLLDGAESLSDWFGKNWGQSITTGYRMLQAADAFADAPNAEQILRQPLSQLLIISKNKKAMEQIHAGELHIGDGQVITPEGETIPLQVFAKQIKDEWSAESESNETKLQNKVKAEKQKVQIKEEMIKGLDKQIEELRAENERITSAMADLAKTKDIDPKRYMLIQQKGEAINLLTEILVQGLEIIGRIDQIPQDIVDPELSGHISRTITSLESAINQARDQWPGVMIHAGRQTASNHDSVLGDPMDDSESLIPK